MHPFDGEGELYDVTLIRCRSATPSHHGADAPENDGTDGNCQNSTTARFHHSSSKTTPLHITNTSPRRVPGTTRTGEPCMAVREDSGSVIRGDDYAGPLRWDRSRSSRYCFRHNPPP